MLDLTEISGGIPLIFIHKKRKTGHLVIHFNHGSAADPENAHGALHLLEHMLFKGTKTRSYLDLLCGVERMGADLNAFTTKESMVIHVSYPDEFLPQIADFIGDVVYNSVFDETELKKEKRVIADEIRSYRDTPTEFIYDEFEKMMFGKSNLSHNILGTMASVNRISLNKLEQVYQQVMTGFHIAIVSNRSKENVCQILNQHFGLKPYQSLRKTETTETVLRSKKIKILNDDVSQSHIIAGIEAPSYSNPLQLPAYLLANFLGGNAMSSVLNLELREKRGISYSVEAAMQSYARNGLFYTYLTCDKKRKKQALSIITGIFKHYAENGLSYTEFENIVRMTKSQYTMFFEHSLNEAMFHAKHFQYSGKITTEEKLMKELHNIKHSDINTMCSQLLNFDNHSQIILE
jgi:predicted Zn-dependent peptidase